MKPTTLRSLGCASLFMALMCISSKHVAGDEKTTAKPPVDRTKQIAEGRELFERDWLKKPPRTTTSDGLGPMYNDVSCVGCHNLGGVGGAGPLLKNVDLLSVVSPRSRGLARRSSFDRIVQRVHPDFGAGSKNLILHRFGRDAAGSLAKYNVWRNKLLNIDDREKFTTTSLFRTVSKVRVQMTQRNTPALFGAGMIDSIPDSVLIEAAEKQKNDRRGISGRVPQTTKGSVGRFGWRGQIASLQEFVESACAAELGLGVPRHRQNENPLENPKPVNAVRSGRRGSGFFQIGGAAKIDLTQEQCDALTTFVASLPAPEPVKNLHLEDSKLAMAGEKQFNKIGCADCHRRDLGPAKGIFSDLLLHDMGRRLADPLAAMPELSREDAVNLNGYYGVSTDEILAKATTNIRQEWKTPPLWGVRDSAPYLHDGRAASLETAILMHDGEAKRTAAAFKSLKRKQRKQVVLFLHSLVPPGAKPNGLNSMGVRGGGSSGGGFFSVDN